jgi:hypothetical protein
MHKILLLASSRPIIRWKQPSWEQPSWWTVRGPCSSDGPSQHWHDDHGAVRHGMVDCWDAIVQPTIWYMWAIRLTSTLSLSPWFEPVGLINWIDYVEATILQTIHRFIRKITLFVLLNHNLNSHWRSSLQQPKQKAIYDKIPTVLFRYLLPQVQYYDNQINTNMNMVRKKILLFLVLWYITYPSGDVDVAADHDADTCW